MGGSSATEGWNFILRVFDSAGAGAVFNLMAMAGGIVIVWMIISALSAKFKKQKLRFSDFDGRLLMAAVLLAPRVIIPALLWLIDIVIRIVTAALQALPSFG